MKKHKKIIIDLIVIVLIVSIVTFLIIKNKKTKSFEEPQESMHQFIKEDMDRNDIKDFEQISENGTTKEMTDKTNRQNKKTTTLKTQTEVKSALTENIELHATYYLKEVYVEKNQFIEAGENILKYTNGTYLVAPYDCYIIELNLPALEGKALNSHYVQISSSNLLMVTMNVEETNIEKINIGLEATIEVTSLGKTYKGNITHIASTGNNGKFEIKIEFENDSDVKIGMTGAVSITI